MRDIIGADPAAGHAYGVEWRPDAPVRAEGGLTPKLLDHRFAGLGEALASSLPLRTPCTTRTVFQTAMLDIVGGGERGLIHRKVLEV